MATNRIPFSVQCFTCSEGDGGVWCSGERGDEATGWVGEGLAHEASGRYPLVHVLNKQLILRNVLVYYLERRFKNLEVKFIHTVWRGLVYSQTYSSSGLVGSEIVFRIGCWKNWANSWITLSSWRRIYISLKIKHQYDGVISKFNPSFQYKYITSFTLVG